MSRIVWEICVRWKSLEQRTVAPQLIRAADSIGANIAEGSGRGSDKDYIRFLRISRGSLYETKHWLRLAFARGLLSAEETDQLKRVVDELTPKLNAYIKAVSRMEKTSRIDEDQSPKTEDL
jgi:four helix bundle protein